jgi:N-methylhydantoinase A
VIAEHTATTVIHAGDLLRVGDHGEMVITIPTETAATETAATEIIATEIIAAEREA